MTALRVRLEDAMRATTDAVVALQEHEAAAAAAAESNLELETEDVEAIVASLELR